MFHIFRFNLQGLKVCFALDAGQGAQERRCPWRDRYAKSSDQGLHCCEREIYVRWGTREEERNLAAAVSQRGNARGRVLWGTEVGGRGGEAATENAMSQKLDGISKAQIRTRQ